MAFNTVAFVKSLCTRGFYAKVKELVIGTITLYRGIQTFIMLIFGLSESFSTNPKITGIVGEVLRKTRVVHKSYLQAPIKW